MANTYWLGKKRSEETRRKISEAQRGRKQPQELIEKRREANRKHGKSRQCYNYREWRRQILERDNGKCVKCGNIHEKMHCHHIIPWKENEELRFSVANGETLCAKCHIKIGRENKEIDGEITQFQKGQKSWIAGKTHSEETRKKLSESLKGKSSWNKGKSLSEDHKKNLRESLKGRKVWNTGTKGLMNSWMKGKSHTEESKRKNSESNKGMNRSPSTQFKKGLIPWNKGLKKD